MSLTEVRVNAAIDASVSGATHMQLHTGDPGAAGTSAVAAGIARQVTSWTAAAGLNKIGTATFQITGPGGPFTHVTLWNGSAGTTYYGYATVNPAEAFNGPGNLTVSLTVSGQSA